ncbi:MAG: GDYXXLXY domain-containing protein [Candidatus Omnitrophica bacterium]|nr:GDYXXLXY domain-containing protein [Candidatus Omnitrophota bacterium]
MKNKQTIIFFLFLVVAFLQIATPFALIRKHEAILKEGEIFKFRTAPIDPFDAFRGRYVALRLEQDKVPMPEGMDLKGDRRIYASITTGEDGCAMISGLSKDPPGDLPYMKVKVRYISGKDVFLDLPIDRYYMEEKAAKLAETVYRTHSRADKRDAYVVVRIKNGDAAIDKLYIGEKPIEDVIREAAPLNK